MAGRIVFYGTATLTLVDFPDSERKYTVTTLLRTLDLVLVEKVRTNQVYTNNLANDLY